MRRAWVCVLTGISVFPTERMRWLIFLFISNTKVCFDTVTLEANLLGTVSFKATWRQTIMCWLFNKTSQSEPTAPATLCKSSLCSGQSWERQKRCKPRGSLHATACWTDSNQSLLNQQPPYLAHLLQLSRAYLVPRHIIPFLLHLLSGPSSPK